MSIEKEIKADMDHSIDHFKTELQNLRSSRANPSILDNVKVEVYGAPMRLRDIANVTAPESRQLLITPFDSNNANAIGKAIETANLNIQPVVDGNVIRIEIPPMDESIRKDTVKILKKKAEEAKVSIREVRRKFNDRVRKEKQEGILAEDQMKSLEKKIQENTDEHCKTIDQLASSKEKEILEI